MMMRRFFLATVCAVMLTTVIALPVASSAASPSLARASAPLTNSFDISPARTAAGFAGVRAHQLPFRPVVPPAVFSRLKQSARSNGLAPFNHHPFDESLLKTTPRGGLTRLTPVPTTSFNGLNNLNGLEPPDMAVAVSDTFVLQSVNTSIAVFSRSGALQPGWPKSWINFYHIPSEGACNPTPFVSDPRTFYDHATKRFFAVALQVSGPIVGNSCAPLSKYWIAVSKTSDPTGAWHVFAFDMRAGTTNVADFTEAGYDANGIYFSGNMFSSTNGSFQYAEIFGVSKAALESGTGATPHGFLGSALGDTVQPVISLTQPRSGTTTQPVEFFVNSINGACSGVCSGVHVWAMANGATATPSLSGVTIGTARYAFPPDGFQPVANFPIATGDLRISASPVFLYGTISFSLNTGVVNGATLVPGVFWQTIQPVLSGHSIAGGSPGQSGTVAFAGTGSAYYGAIMPDLKGDFFLNFGYSSSSTNPSALYVARKPGDPLGTMEPPVVAKAGTTFYQGFRWGDYSASAIDGLTTASQVWMATEYSVSNWSTFIAATHF